MSIILGKMNISLQSLRSSLFWAVIAAVALVAQLGLAAHQLEHRLHPDVAAIAEDCIACQFSSTMVDGPTSSVVPMPIGIELGSIAPAGHALLWWEEFPNSFRARAPPSSVSV